MPRFESALDDHVAVITMTDGENRFNPDFLNDFLSVIDTLETDTDARTLVFKSAHQKIFSNGIDLEWLVPVIGGGKRPPPKNSFTC